MVFEAGKAESWKGQRRLTDVVYDVLLDALVESRLAPGQLLHDRDIAEDLRVSRTPVREALQRLQDVGLVEIQPGRLTRATPLVLEHVSGVAVVLGELLALAAEISTPLLTPDQLDDLERENATFALAVSTDDWESARGSGPTVTRIFVDACPNAVLVDLIEIQRPQVRRWLLATPDGRPRRSWVGHRSAILESARRGDGPKASESLRTLWRELAAEVQAVAQDESTRLRSVD
jgi:DNA-binding GntR family transcriptional regulator